MVKFKNIPDNERPRERLYLNGAEILSNEELLAILIKTGTRSYSVKEVALKLLEELGNISRLKDIGINRLIKIEGIGMVKAIELKAMCELGKRIHESQNNLMKTIVSDALVVYELFKDIFDNKKQEYFYCIYLDTKKRIIEKKCLFIGTINMSLVSPREIFKEAYLVSASSFVCVHNHPTGDSSPSRQDRELTKKLQELGLLHEIPLVDHIIIGKNNYFSFFENDIFWVSNS